MAKNQTRFVCQQCGSVQTKWMGRCPECGEWNSLVETLVQPTPTRASGAAIAMPESQPRQLSEVSADGFERISLGIKQLDGDPFTNYVATHDKGNVVKGTVKSLDGKGAVIALDGEVEGYLRASEVARDRVEDIRTHLKEGDPVTAMIINIDRKNRSINLSIKAKDHAEETEAIQTVKADTSGTSSGTTNLGALLRAKMDNKTTE